MANFRREKQEKRRRVGDRAAGTRERTAALANGDISAAARETGAAKTKELNHRPTGRLRSDTENTEKKYRGSMADSESVYRSIIEQKFLFHN
jgi:hypothetical protein